jgi:hypothetical protein
MQSYLREDARMQSYCNRRDSRLWLSVLFFGLGTLVLAWQAQTPWTLAAVLLGAL